MICKTQPCISCEDMTKDELIKRGFMLSGMMDKFVHDVMGLFGCSKKQAVNVILHWCEAHK